MNSQEKSSLIVGCWQLDDRSWKRIPETDIARALDIYLALGTTHFDTADIYGRSESVLGRLLTGRNCTILTKAVFFGNIPTPAQIRSKIENSLRNLQRDTLDCVQIHWHNPELDFASTFRVFAELLEQGKIRKLGVTNFNTPMLEKALQYATISTHQVQYSLIDRRVENSMQNLCLQHNIALLSYGSLAGGFLSDKFRGISSPPSEGSHARGFYYNSMIRAHGGWQPVLEMLDTLAQVAKKYEKTISQVALNWVKQQPGVAAVISGFTQDRQQIQKNVEALGFQLDKDDVQLLSDRSSTLFKQPGDIYSYER
ncbi:aldo/keto reductase [Trichocoleus sp. DQ-A3]|uniref:aldo/keto reductase n=1 Tax=Cyanophyceae TaxID=3028117 RepID=UPI0016887B2A|nr:aldo/keto reductase [Coleofasciculus sp. FACHB-125]MBD1899012.1 aldo/keto reductase [Coleofasciculus sp. FACHB-125]